MSREWALEPWSREVVAAADEYMAARRSRGYSGRFWFQFAWVDDTSVASLRVFTATACRVRYEVWRELQWIWDVEKSTQYLFGQPQIPATVGCELVVPQRRMELPQAKRQKYERLANELCADAVSHPRALVESVKLERVIGQLLHAADFYIEMWIFFLELIYSIGSDMQLATRTVLSKAARHCIREMVRIMQTGEGRPFTPYRLRPGGDGLPVWMTRTDAGRNKQARRAAKRIQRICI